MVSPLEEDLEGPRGRCDGGIERGGASLCVRLDMPKMHSIPLRSHRAHVGLRWLHRTLDSLQALHDARSRIVFLSCAMLGSDVVLRRVLRLLGMRVKPTSLL